MTKHLFVIVSNRLPMSVSKKDGKLTYESSSGGLATAMSSLREDDTIWVGWCGMPSDDLSSKDKQAIREHFAKHNAYPVFLTGAQIENFYEGYSNDTLWPLFHYFQSLSQQCRRSRPPAPASAPCRGAWRRSRSRRARPSPPAPAPSTEAESRRKPGGLRGTWRSAGRSSSRSPQ